MMRCDDGCGLCCGIVPCSPLEYAAVRSYAEKNGIRALEQGTTCPFFQGGRCAVYPVRPGVCRLFGHVEEMPCPHGYNVNIPSAEGRAFIRKTSLSKTPRALHQLIEETGEGVIAPHVRTVIRVLLDYAGFNARNTALRSNT